MPEKCELSHVAKAICRAKNYEYIHFINSGAFKETYQVMQQGENYALKVFKSNNSKERTDREINAMSCLHCSHIAKLILVDTFNIGEQTFLYLIEEYLSGGSLGSIMEKSTLSRAEIFSIGKDIIKALESTYRHHLVHRDIKPDNIMFRGDQSDAVLIDFGLVRDLDESSLTKAFFMRGPGTPIYSAPEQLNNEKALIDWRTDQFALGVTLFEAIAGFHPFNKGSINQTVEYMATKSKCNKETIDKINDLKLSPLLKMIEPYPINRYRLPEQLIMDWNMMEEFI